MKKVIVLLVCVSIVFSSICENVYAGQAEEIIHDEEIGEIDIVDSVGDNLELENAEEDILEYEDESDDLLEIEDEPDDVSSIQAETIFELSGSGTKTDPYYIYNSTDFVNFIKYIYNGVSGRQVNNSGVYYALKADIDMSGVSLPSFPSNNNNPTFNATLYGDKHCISNIKIETRCLFKTNNGNIYNTNFYGVTLSGTDEAGIIAYTNNGTISGTKIDGTVNFVSSGSTSARAGLLSYTNKGTIEECSILGTAEIGISGNCSGFGGFAYNNSGTNGTITSCSNHATININANTVCHFGGIAYSNSTNSSVEECEFGGQLIIPEDGKNLYAAGIVYENNGRIDNCKNTSDNMSSYSSAGIVYENTKSGEISECNSSAKINARMDAGGIVGINNNTIENCDNTGCVCGNSRAGGIAVSQSKGVISECNNFGIIQGGSTGGIVVNVSSGNISYCCNYSDISGDSIASYSGGVIGYLAGYSGSVYVGPDGNCIPNVSVDNCINEGKILGKARSVGGLIGTVWSGSGGVAVTNCSNKGDIEYAGTGCAGGCVGTFGDTPIGSTCKSACIMNCSNSGNISSAANAIGGIVGIFNSGIIQNCCNEGLISGSYRCGGLVGDMSLSGNTLDDESLPQLINSYNLGGVSSSKSNASLGGLVGQSSEGKISRCYNLGDISTEYLYDINMGGLIGYTFPLHNRILRVNDCFSAGCFNAMGKTNLGGLIGAASYNGYSALGDNNETGLIVTNCYAMNIDTAIDEKPVYYDDKKLGGLIAGAVYGDSVIFNHVYALDSNARYPLFYNINKPENNTDVRRMSEAEMMNENNYQSWEFLDSYDMDTDHGWKMGYKNYRYPVLINVGEKALKNYGSSSSHGSFDAKELMTNGNIVIYVINENGSAVENAKINIDSRILYTNKEGKAYLPKDKGFDYFAGYITISKRGYEVLSKQNVNLHTFMTFKLEAEEEYTNDDLFSVNTQFETDGMPIKIDGEEADTFDFLNNVTLDLSSGNSKLKLVVENDKENKQYKISIAPAATLEEWKSGGGEYYYKAKDITEKLLKPGTRIQAIETIHTISFNTSVCGYATIGYDKRIKESGLSIAASGSDTLKVYTNGIRYTSYTLTGTVTGKFVWKNTENGNEWEGSFGLAASLGIAIGVGFDMANAQVAFTGTYYTTVNIPFYSEQSSISAGIKGDVKAEITLFNFSYEQPVFEIDWEIYPEFKTNNASVWGKAITLSSADSEFEPLNRLYLSSDSSISPIYANNMGISGTEWTNMYPDGRVRYGELANGTKLLLWLHDFGEKTDINRTTLTYSINSGSGWSAPKAIKETGRGDFYPNLFVDNNKAYVVWLNASKEFDSDDTLADMKENMDMYVSVYENGEFFAPDKIADSNTRLMAISPLIVADKDKMAVAWIENDKNDILLSNGTNSIYLSERNNGIWSPAKKVVSTRDAITDYDLKYNDGMPALSYSTKTTVSERNYSSKLFLYMNGNTMDVTKVSGTISDIEIAGRTLYFCNDEKLKAIDIDNVEHSYSTGVNCSGMKVVENREGEDAIIYSLLKENGSALYAVYEKNGSYTKPLPILESDDTIVYFDAVYDTDGSLAIAADEKDADGNVSMKVYDSLVSNDFAVNEALLYDGEKIGVNTTTLYATAYNHTIFDISKVKAQLYAGNTEVASEEISVNLPSAESGIIEFPYSFPNNMQKNTYRLKITPIGIEETNLDNNTAQIEIGFGNLALKDVEYRNGKIIGSVENNGYETVSKPTITILQDGSEGNKLAEISYSGTALNPGSEWKFESLLSEPVEFNDFESKYFYVEVSSEDTEENYGDNSIVITASPILPDTVELSETELTMAEKTTKQLTATLSRTDGRVIDNSKIIFTTEDPAVAVVDADGKVIAVGKGETIIHAVTVDGEAGADCIISVSADEGAENYSISDTTLGMFKGEVGMLSIADEEGSEIEEGIIWNTGNESIVSVNSNGALMADGEGITFVYGTIPATEAEDGYYSYVCMVEVRDKNIRELYSADTEVVLDTFDTKTINVSVIPEDTTNDKTLVYSSSDTRVASVDEMGRIYAYSPGSTIITVKSKANPEVEITIRVKVNTPPSRKYTIAFDSCGGNDVDEIQNQYSGYSIYDFPMPYKDGFVFAGWYTEPNGGGTCIEAPYKVTGDVTLYACWMVRTKEKDNSETIEKTLHVGESVKLDDLPLGAVYSSSDVAVITIDELGNLTAVSEGNAVIYAFSDTKDIEYYISVVPIDEAYSDVTEKTNPVDKLTICKDDDSVKDVYYVDITDVDEKALKLFAKISPEDADDSNNIEWKSSNTSVADLEVDGTDTQKVTIIPKNSGRALITATSSNGVDDTVWVEIKSPQTPDFALSETNIILYENGEGNRNTVQLTPIVDGEIATDLDLIWKSTNPDVVSVSDDGIVTAVSITDSKRNESSAVVSATDAMGSGKYAICSITVKREAKSIVSAASGLSKIKLMESKTFSLEADVLPKNATDKKLTFISDDSSIAVIDAKGKITAKGKGLTVVRVKAGDSGVEESFTVEVIEKANADELTDKVVINGDTNDGKLITLNSGQTLSLSAICQNKFGNSLDTGVLWKSSNNNILSIDSDGMVTAIGKGTATVTATAIDGSGKKCVSNKITVTVPPVKIELNKNTVYLTPGASESLKASVLPNGSISNGVSWKLSETVGTGITISSAGRISVEKSATVGSSAVIVAYVNGQGEIEEAVCNVVVIGKKISSLKLDQTKISVTGVGRNLNVKAVLSPTDINLDEGVVWTSSDTNVVAVDEPLAKDVISGQSTACITTTGYGTAELTAVTADGVKKAKCVIKVFPLEETYKLSAVNNSGLLETYAVNSKSQCVFKIKNQFGTVIDPSMFEYSVSNDLIVVDEKGIVTANPGNLKAGKATVTAVLRSDPSKRSVKFNVQVLNTVQADYLIVRRNIEGEYLDVNEIKQEYKAGEVVEIKGVAFDANNTQLSTKVTYSVTDKKKATVAVRDESCFITIKAPGHFAVTCTANDTFKNQVVIPISAVSPEPSVSATKVTLNKKKTDCSTTAFDILANNGSEILFDSNGSESKVERVMIGKKEAASDISDKFILIKNDDGTYAIALTDSAGISGKYTVELKLVTDAIEELGEVNRKHITYKNIEVLVEEKSPSVKVTAEAINTFYSDDESRCALLSFNSAEIIENVGVAPESTGIPSLEFVIKKADERFYLEYLGESCKKNVKCMLFIWVKGFSEPVSADVSLKLNSTAPSYSFDKKVVLDVRGYGEAKLKLLDSKTKMPVNDFVISGYSADGVSIEKKENGTVSAKLNAFGRALQDENIKAKVYINNSENPFATDVPVDLMIQIKSSKAGFSVSSKKTTLNLACIEEVAVAGLIKECDNDSILDASMWSVMKYDSRTRQYSPCDDFVINLDSSKSNVIIGLNPENEPETGTHKIRLSKVIDERRSEYSDFSVSVINKAPSVSFKMSGSLDMVKRGMSSVTLTPAFSNIDGKITSVKLGDSRFYAILNANNTILVKLKDAVEDVIPQTVTVPVTITTTGKTVLSGDVKIKIVQGNPSIKKIDTITFKKAQLNQRTAVNMRDLVETGATISNIEITESPLEISATTDGKYIYVQMVNRNINDGNYNVKVNVYYKGAQKIAGYPHGKPQSVTLTIKVVEN